MNLPNNKKTSPTIKTNIRFPTEGKRKTQNVTYKLIQAVYNTLYMTISK